MSGINWTMKALNQLFPKSTIKLPFDSGLFKKETMRNGFQI